MSFQVGCCLASVLALAVLFFMLDRRVQRLEKLASQAERVKNTDEQ